MSKHTVVARTRVPRRGESGYEDSNRDVVVGRGPLGSRRDASVIDLREERGLACARCEMEASPFVVDWAPPAG
jgi:hypothetical protein